MYAQGHEVAPHTSNPESRGDLEALTRLATENFSAAFGLPADLIFSGRFAGKSTSQYVMLRWNPCTQHYTHARCLFLHGRLSLLNTTVSQLAKAVNSVLTLCYRDIYSEGVGDEVGQLQLLTSPLAATEEVLNLFTGGLVPLEIAMPSVLHAIGATKEDIDSAVEKAKEKEDELKNDDNTQKEYTNSDNAINLQIKQVDLDQKKKELKEPTPKPSTVSSSKSSD